MHRKKAGFWQCCPKSTSGEGSRADSLCVVAQERQVRATGGEHTNQQPICQFTDDSRRLCLALQEVCRGTDGG